MSATKEKMAINVQRHLPVHIAIKMDGNGRWAKKRGMPRLMGHAAGVETLRMTTRYCNKIGIRYLTVYAFSTENWKRPKSEVDGIMKLLKEYLRKEIKNFRNEQIRVRFIGKRAPLSEDIISLMDEAEEMTKNCAGLVLTIALNYGGRQEITEAAKKIAREVVKGSLTIDRIEESTIQDHIFTTGQPDPDLILMPGGEVRISNFLLWQSAYAEYWFSDILWPDFTPTDLEHAIDEYSVRNRRFGNL